MGTHRLAPAPYYIHCNFSPQHSDLTIHPVHSAFSSHTAMFTECIFQSSKFDDWERPSKTNGNEISFLKISDCSPRFVFLVRSQRLTSWLTSIITRTRISNRSGERSSCCLWSACQLRKPRGVHLKRSARSGNSHHRLLLSLIARRATMSRETTVQP